MEKNQELKEKIIEILCGRKNDEIGKKCKTMFDGSADQILALLEAEKKKWVEETEDWEREAERNIKKAIFWGEKYKALKQKLKS